MFPLLTCGKQQRSSDRVERLCFEEGNIEEEKMDNGSTMTHKMIGGIYTKCFTGTQIKKDVLGCFRLPNISNIYESYSHLLQYYLRRSSVRNVYVSITFQRVNTNFLKSLQITF